MKKEIIKKHKSAHRRIYLPTPFDILKLDSFYEKIILENKTDFYLNPTKIYNVIESFNNKLIKDLSESTTGINLPNYFGKLTVNTITNSKSVVANETSKRPRFMNHNTNGKVLKIVFNYKGKEVRVKNLDCWNVINARYMKKYISKNAENNYNRYTEYETDYLIQKRKEGAL